MYNVVAFLWAHNYANSKFDGLKYLYVGNI